MNVQRTELESEKAARRAAEERVRQLEQQLERLRSSRNGDST